MQGMTRRWIMRPTPVDAPSDIDGGPPGLVERILRARGLTTADAARRFCEPRLSDLHDPSLLPGIEIAATRILEAVHRREVIAIYGDYDVDGIAATAILHHLIKAIDPEAQIVHYVPHRLDEGYGLNCEALGALRGQGVRLVISVDCGVTAHRSANTARDIGLDLIITDHHAAHQNLLPDALAVVHPALPGSQYPFADLCGAGVAFKLAWRLATMWCNSSRVSQALQRTLLDLLPLAALGTIADVVPLVGENRTITSFGLRLIKTSPWIGLNALIEASALAGEHIGCEQVGFTLAPRLNACGRMGHARHAVRLLTEAPPDEAARLARELAEQNTGRQVIERRIFDQAATLAEDSGSLREDVRAIVLAHESWHPGVVGIVCSRMVERFGRPTILLHRGADLCKGSARSIDGYSIHAALATTAHLLTTFGGHAMAAGLSLPPSNLEAFAHALCEHARHHINLEQLTPSLQLDCEASLEELSTESIHRLQSMAPFGRGNAQPVVCVRRLVLQEPPRTVGAQGRHLQLRARDETDSRRRVLKMVWFNGGRHASDMAAGIRLEAAIEPKLNHWNGQTSVEGHIKDLRLSPA